MNKKTIFIHSIFRTGSTYIWNKFRQSQQYYCYYEPFHQEMANLEHGKPGPWRHDKKCTQLMRHPDLDISYLEEYSKFLQPGVKGVPFFKKAFSFDDFCNTAGEKNTDQKKYIDFLIREAGEKIPVLQFNRSSLRISWFKANYPDNLHIYLVRNPVDQFQSYIEMYEKVGLNSFLTMDLIAAGVNQHSGFFKPLASHIPLFEYHDDIFENERFIYSHFVPLYTAPEKYFIFYYTWFLSLMENTLNADLLLNIDGLSSHPDYRDTVHRFLKARGIDTVDFNDSNVGHYETTVLDRGEADRIRDTVQSIILKRYTNKQIEQAAENLGENNRHFFDIDLPKLKSLKAKKVEKDPGVIKNRMNKFYQIFDHLSRQLLDRTRAGRDLEKELRNRAEDAAELKKEIREKDREIMEMSRMLEQKELLLERKDKEIAQKDTQLGRKEKQIVQKEQVREQKERQLKQKEKQLATKDLKIVQEEQVLEEKNRQLKLKNEQLDLKDRQLEEGKQALEEKTRQLKLKNEQLDLKNQRIENAYQVLEAKDRQLKLKEEQLEEAKESLEKKDLELERKQNQLECKTQRIQQFTEILEEKDRQLKQLREEIVEKDREIIRNTGELKIKSREMKQKNIRINVLLEKKNARDREIAEKNKRILVLKDRISRATSHKGYKLLKSLGLIKPLKND